MNRELATYIRGLTGEVAKNIWLDAFISMKRNGTALIVKRDVLLQYRITEEEFKKYFHPKDAENLNLIKILAEGETFISINFRKREVPVKLDKPQQKEENKAVIAKNPEAALVISEKQNAIVLNEYGLITSEIDATFAMTEKCKRYIIGDYCAFFKKLQINTSYLAGIPMPNPVNPKIEAKEVRHLKDIARYFVSIGFNTEVKIIIAFQRMYDQWENLSERLQKMNSPGGIYAALNDIVQELAQINNKKHKQPKQTPKDEQFNSKVDAARQKDYSHLAKP
jgi:hypothetical protein